jgi:hypothetical protein
LITSWYQALAGCVPLLALVLVLLADPPHIGKALLAVFGLAGILGLLLVARIRNVASASTSPQSSGQHFRSAFNNRTSVFAAVASR